MTRRDYYDSWCSPFLVYGGLFLESVREPLQGWHGSFIEKRWIKAWRAAPTCIFWTIWKERNMRFFDSEELFDQRLKSLFLNNFSIGVRVYIGDDYTQLINFIEWLGIG